MPIWVPPDSKGTWNQEHRPNPPTGADIIYLNFKTSFNSLLVRLSCASALDIFGWPNRRDSGSSHRFSAFRRLYTRCSASRSLNSTDGKAIVWWLHFEANQINYSFKAGIFESQNLYLNSYWSVNNWSSLIKQILLIILKLNNRCK